MAASSSVGSVWDTPHVYKHHAQQNVCHTRPKYRQGRRARAVKVYTINLESRFLLVQGVPAIGVMTELIQLFALYGAIEEYRVLDEYPAEEFTEVYLIKFQKLTSARAAKRKTDEKSFYGGQLHVCYAPEHETVEDTRKKLQDRRRYVSRACQKSELQPKEATNSTSEASAAVYSAPWEDEKRDYKIHEEASNSNTDSGFYILPLPPHEEAAQQYHCSKESFNSHSDQRISAPTEDKMGSLHNSVPSAPDHSKQTSHFQNTASSCNKEKELSRKHKHPSTSLPRFIPRTTHLGNRKRKAEDNTNLNMANTKGPVFGPQLPEAPKTDMDDDSLNITTELIRQTMAKVASVPSEKKSTATKPRRRI